MAIKFEVDNSLLAAREARRRLRSLREWLQDETLDTVELLVSEVVTNSIRHAAIPPGGKIALRAKRLPEGLLIEVSNPGARFAKPVASSPRHGSGWGLFLLDQLAKSWGIRHKRGLTTVWFAVTHDR